ncbi:unnamed protein product [Mytilus coruscus]|uniref:Endonuclease/exonuclease/phosphatase domain-containing protein n=1 Tax=Mytilus coruscus TaxID=42192 RepID=A0A6J8CS25_MYTCO|nr:unnamed protein product [Mytilus coruscus]
MNTVKTVLTTTILTLFLANCVKLDLIVNCKTVNSNRNIKENKEAPDKSWSVTISNQETFKSNIYTTSMIVITRKTKTIKYDRLVLTYLCSILLTNSYAPEPNPGSPKYLCGSCNKACTWKQKAVCCDSCDQWYHIKLPRVLCKKTDSNIWVSGDFNLGHIDWNTPAVVPSKSDASLDQQLFDILNDNNLTQVINKNTRNDITLDLLCMTNPSFVNRVETLPPIGARDHDIVYSEINLALPQNNNRLIKY